MHQKLASLKAASLLTLACCATPLVAQADALLWSDNSLSYLNGTDYKVDGGGAGKTQQTITFEHVSGWSWGDVFMFVDNKWFNGVHGSDGYSYYGEFSPRLSFGKISNTDLSFGPIKDVLLAATYERGKDRNRKYLLGPGFDLNVPGFDRMSVNIYYRKPDGITGKAAGQWQFNPTWAMTIPVGKSDILFDGYLEWYINDVGTKDSSDYVASGLHFNPQVKYDVGKALGGKPKAFYAGLEYDYWSNKYGIENDSYLGDVILGGTDQSAISLLLKAHF